MDRDEVKSTLMEVMLAQGAPIGSPPSPDEFEDLKIKLFVPARALPGWDTFKWQTLAVAIQDAFDAKDRFVEDFDGNWLRTKKDEPCSVLVDYCDDNLIALPPLEEA